MQKNMNDYKGSISIIWVGSAVGIDRLVLLFLCSFVVQRIKDESAISPIFRGDLKQTSWSTCRIKSELLYTNCVYYLKNVDGSGAFYL